MNVEMQFPAEAGGENLAAGSRHTNRFNALTWFKKQRWFALCVIAPTLIAAVYYCMIAPDIYISESRFVIKSPDEKRPQLSSLANLIQTTGLTAGQAEANEIMEFTRSRDALQNLQKSIDIRKRYERSHDFIAGFPPLFSDRSFESLFKFYTSKVDANTDPQTGTAVLSVKAYTPQDAYLINATLLKLSEGMVNRLNERAQNHAIAEAQKQVDIATQRAKTVSLQLTRYRNGTDLIDPGKQALGVVDIANTLVAKRAAMQAQLDLMMRVAPRNPAIPALRDQIAAISRQIEQQNGRVVGTDSGIASKLGGYEDLLVEQKFANESLTAANAALVQARAEAQRQQFYLERIVDPNVPDSPQLPYRLLSILTVAAAALCLFFIGWMLVVGILEHAPEK